MRYYHYYLHKTHAGCHLIRQLYKVYSSSEDLIELKDKTYLLKADLKIDYVFSLQTPCRVTLLLHVTC